MLESIRFLIVEDNANMATILRTMLQGLGCRDIKEARDVGHGLEIVMNSRPDIALVDFELEDMNGVEFVNFVRGAPDSVNPYLPIIMITAHSSRGVVGEALEAGVNEFLTKPISAKALYDRVYRIIEAPRMNIKVDNYRGPDRRRANLKLTRKDRRQN